eukprot:2088203-Pleurochrysis_carterae.AAC.1
MAAACGLDPDKFGGKCWRIGGATDLCDTARPPAGRSADLANATGVDMEALVEGWSQPSTFR